MKQFRRTIAIAAALACLALAAQASAANADRGPAASGDVSPVVRQATPARPVLAIHGGAGVVRAGLSPEDQAAARAGLERALLAGHAKLQAGAPALDAVIAAITVLEDDPAFNAGHGAVFTHEGRNELDASLMDGRDGNAGAVAGVTRVRNPILLARAVMEHSPHVMLVGSGAETFAEGQGIEMVDPGYFRTERRWEQLQRALQQEQEQAAAAAAARTGATPPGKAYAGTVGALALDAQGRLAAGTSTGGMTNKRWGRVGDSPLVGAGTYADDRTCAVSATGHGEYFIRLAVAHDVSARMMYAGESVQEAAAAVIHERLADLGGTGGVIAMDAAGHVAMPFNTPGMFRGTITADGTVTIEIYGD